MDKMTSTSEEKRRGRGVSAAAREIYAYFDRRDDLEKSGTYFWVECRLCRSAFEEANGGVHPLTKSSVQEPTPRKNILANLKKHSETCPFVLASKKRKQATASSGPLSTKRVRGVAARSRDLYSFFDRRVDLGKTGSYFYVECKNCRAAFQESSGGVHPITQTTVSSPTPMKNVVANLKKHIESCPFVQASLHASPPCSSSSLSQTQLSSLVVRLIAAIPLPPHWIQVPEFTALVDFLRPETSAALPAPRDLMGPLLEMEAAKAMSESIHLMQKQVASGTAVLGLAVDRHGFIWLHAGPCWFPWTPLPNATAYATNNGKETLDALEAAIDEAQALTGLQVAFVCLHGHGLCHFASSRRPSVLFAPWVNITRLVLSQMEPRLSTIMAQMLGFVDLVQKDPWLFDQCLAKMLLHDVHASSIPQQRNLPHVSSLTWSNFHVLCGALLSLRPACIAFADAIAKPEVSPVRDPMFWSGVASIQTLLEPFTTSHKTAADVLMLLGRLVSRKESSEVCIQTAEALWQQMDQPLHIAAAALDVQHASTIRRWLLSNSFGLTVAEVGASVHRLYEQHIAPDPAKAVVEQFCQWMWMDDVDNMPFRHNTPLFWKYMRDQPGFSKLAPLALLLHCVVGVPEDVRSSHANTKLEQVWIASKQDMNPDKRSLGVERRNLAEQWQELVNDSLGQHDDDATTSSIESVQERHNHHVTPIPLRYLFGPQVQRREA
ncbi:unnamed protein product [Aphanomyces euteiches]